MTGKEGPSLFALVSANILWRFVRLDLKSCFSSSVKTQSRLLLATLRTLKKCRLFWQQVNSTNTKSSLFYSKLKSFQHQRAKFWFKTPLDSYNLSKWHDHVKCTFYRIFTKTNDLHTVDNNRRKKIPLIPNLHSWASFRPHIF
jgi:hypothetical protein